ncbi:MAG: DUF473 domain-containing protein [Methanomethylovorans sp.]|uniref:DUF473 domain-containing protein n=1 Tax=Methanomethylovorans sp. TaxID=2758717 RepID=UPI00261EC921|nr:DUF473 domain-containing protein [Methanomethylovorans sp.]
MEYIALTGISERVISELRNHHPLTIEVRSPNNFFAAYKTNVGDLIFITHVSPDDLHGGTMGIVAKVLKHQVITHRVVQSNDIYYEEREMTMLRIQLEPRFIARVRRVSFNQICKAAKVDAEEMPFFNAR